MIRLLARILIVVIVTSSAVCVAQDPLPTLGALVALDSGQTIWIAPINGKMQAISRDELVIPRKNGFWRIRVDETPWPDFEPVDSGEVRAPGEPLPGSLWSVPLSRGPDAVPWEPQQAKTDDDQTADAENADDAAAVSQDESVHRRDVTFLSPDHISLYTVTGEYSETYGIYRISDPLPGTSVLQVHQEPPAVTEVQVERDLARCADPKDELANAQFLEGASEVSYGIVRGRREWAYAWLLGYASGAARGYHTQCPTSAVLPRSIAGPSDRFPSWKAIKDAFPEAQDAFTSPAHDLVLVVLADRLAVAPVRNGAVGKSLIRLDTRSKLVMVQWALGPYVEQWTKQLTPYFGAYKPKAENPQ